VLTAAALAALVSFAACDRFRPETRFREQAQAELRAANPAEAAELFYRAYDANPQGPQAARNLYDYARTNDLELNRHDFAVELYKRFVAAFPADDRAPESLERMAVLYSEQLDSPLKAIDTLSRIVDEYPGFTRTDAARLALAREYEKLGNRDQAALKYEQFTREFPRSPLAARAWFRLAAIQSMRGEYPEALRSLERAEESFVANPGDPPAETADFTDLVRIEKGRALEMMDDPARAADTYRSVSSGYSGIAVIQARIAAIEKKIEEEKAKAEARPAPPPRR